MQIANSCQGLNGSLQGASHKNFNSQDGEDPLSHRVMNAPFFYKWAFPSYKIKTPYPKGTAQSCNQDLKYDQFSCPMDEMKTVRSCCDVILS